jgi:hypothetical protein
MQKSMMTTAQRYHKIDVFMLETVALLQLRSLSLRVIVAALLK